MEQRIENEGIRLGPPNANVPVPLEVDFLHDEEQSDLILLNPPDDAVNIWKSSDPQVIVYSAIGFNDKSVAFRNVDSREKGFRIDMVRSVIKKN